MSMKILEVANKISNQLNLGIMRLDYQFNIVTLKASTRVWFTDNDYIDIVDDGNWILHKNVTYNAERFITCKLTNEV